MFAKFVIYSGRDKPSVSDRRGNHSCRVVPYTNQILEGDRFEYEKIRLKSAKQYEELLDNRGSSHEILSYMPDIDQAVNFNNGDGFEIILLSAYKGDSVKNYISTEDTVLFIMNENGKTIDKIACRNNR
jgi:hypothetical protein